jgi:hypothetical protein
MGEGQTMPQQRIFRNFWLKSGFCNRLGLVFSCVTTLICLVPLVIEISPTGAHEWIEIPDREVRDRIYGGWVGMLIGGVEGLPHEFKYRDQPRETLPEFTFLTQGARSDDDNDIEWTHLWFMYREGRLLLPYPRLAEIWKQNMNQGIWRANKCARLLMDEGLIPPETGSWQRNPHAWYNLSGQFATESYGLLAPGMPPVAARIGLHYAGIAVSGEPLQAAQFWPSMVSLAFLHRGRMESLVEEALKAIDPASALAAAVQFACQAYRRHPEDWKQARQEVHEEWLLRRRWNDNSTPVNGALVCLALLYGQGDFYRTLQYAMALGHDADCNAATAGTIVGVLRGWQHIRSLPQCQVADRYVNRTRPGLPHEITISQQVEILYELAGRCIQENGGKITRQPGHEPIWRIPIQPPQVIEPLPADAPKP